jgi:hypothetical protein
MTINRVSSYSRDQPEIGDRLTGDFRIVSKIPVNTGPRRGRGGVTPHMRTSSMRALDKRSSLSFTEEDKLSHATLKMYGIPSVKRNSSGCDKDIKV